MTWIHWVMGLLSGEKAELYLHFPVCFCRVHSEKFTFTILNKFKTVFLSDFLNSIVAASDFCYTGECS